MKNKAFSVIEREHPYLISMADYICDNPEIGLHEFKASEIITEYLEKNNFTVERGVAGLQTAFRAVWNNGKGGPRFGLICEYDALEGIGHGCSHHIQGPSILGAAVALKEAADPKKPFSIVVYGTPAEETVGCKINMLKAGCFKDIDIALMMHASSTGTGVDNRTLALSTYNVTFHGKSAHAAIRPEMGRSALDALLLSFNAIEFLREHVPDDIRMHYAITDGGMPANAVSAHAAAQIIIRSYDRDELNGVLARIDKILEGASLMTETSFTVERGADLDNSIPVQSLQNALMENAKLVGAPDIAPPRAKSGSTDFGNICHVLPGACIRLSTDCGIPAAGHSKEAAAQGKNDEHHAAIAYAAKIIAATVIDIILDSDLYDEIKKDFDRVK